MDGTNIITDNTIYVPIEEIPRGDVMIMIPPAKGDLLTLFHPGQGRFYDPDNTDVEYSVAIGGTHIILRDNYVYEACFRLIRETGGVFYTKDGQNRAIMPTKAVTPFMTVMWASQPEVQEDRRITTNSGVPELRWRAKTILRETYEAWWIKAVTSPYGRYEYEYEIEYPTGEVFQGSYFSRSAFMGWETMNEVWDGNR